MDPTSLFWFITCAYQNIYVSEFSKFIEFSVFMYFMGFFVKIPVARYYTSIYYLTTHISYNVEAASFELQQ